MEGETSKDSYGNILTGCSLAEAAEEVTKNKSFLEEKVRSFNSRNSLA